MIKENSKCELLGFLQGTLYFLISFNLISALCGCSANPVVPLQLQEGVVCEVQNDAAHSEVLLKMFVQNLNNKTQICDITEHGACLLDLFEDGFPVERTAFGNERDEGMRRYFDMVRYRFWDGSINKVMIRAHDQIRVIIKLNELFKLKANTEYTVVVRRLNMLAGTRILAGSLCRFRTGQVKSD